MIPTTYFGIWYAKNKLVKRVHWALRRSRSQLDTLASGMPRTLMLLPWYTALRQRGR